MNTTDHQLLSNNVGKLFTSDRGRTATIRHPDVVENVEDIVPGVVPTISHHVSLVNGGIVGSANRPNHVNNNVGNGFIPNGRPTFGANQIGDSYM